MKNIQLVFLTIILIITVAILVLVITNRDCKCNEKEMLDGYFDLSDYEDRLNEELPIEYSKYFLVHDITVAKVIANVIWEDAYGKDSSNHNKPYKVYYDCKNNVWLVTGSLPEDSLGVVAHLIIKTNGEILAVWYE